MRSKIFWTLWVGVVVTLTGSLTLFRQFRWCQKPQMPQASAEVIRQTSPADCGPAALATVARFYGLEIQLQEIARLAGTTDAGTTLYGLAQAAEKMGLEVTGHH